MSWFSIELTKVEDNLRALVTGKIAEANMHPVISTMDGNTKHNWVMEEVLKIVPSLVIVGKSLVHALVGLIFAELAAKTPAILKPVEDAAQGAVDSIADKALDKLTPSPFAVVPTPAAVGEQQQSVLSQVLAAPTPKPLAP